MSVSSMVDGEGREGFADKVKEVGGWGTLIIEEEYPREQQVQRH